jgi:two-component system, response regulator YesN
VKINIIVVEDEISVNKHISEFIKDLGKPYHLIGSAYNGEQALRYFNEQPIHIVLMDIRMPHMDGIEFMKIVSEKWPESKMVVISGYNDFKYAQQALKLGALDYLLKPLKREELISRLVKIASSIFNDANVYTHLMMNPEKWDMKLIQLESELFDQIELGNTEGSKICIKKLLSAFVEKVGDDHFRLIPFIADSLLALNKRMSALDLFTVHLYLEERWNELKNGLLPNRSFEEIEEDVTNFILYCTTLIHNFRTQTSPDVLHRCQDILSKHYTKEITLNEMSQLLAVTPSYLSRLFKKELGVNYTEYLNNIRILKAKELLHSPNMKVMEVSRMVGYNNAHYFSKMFKRIAGVTPLEYRERIEGRRT